MFNVLSLVPNLATPELHACKSESSLLQPKVPYSTALATSSSLTKPTSRFGISSNERKPK